MQSKRRFSIHLDTDESLCACASASSLFFFLKSAFHLFLVGLMHCLQKQTSFFIKTFIKNGSHGTIYTFKNYFAKVFSVFSFQQNKRYPNGPLVCVWAEMKNENYFTIQLIFANIHGPHYTFQHYLWDTLYYFN